MACNPNNSYVSDAGDHFEVVINGSKVEDVWYNESNREAAQSQAENDFNYYCESYQEPAPSPYAGVTAHVIYAGEGLCQFVLTYPDGRNIANAPTDCYEAQGLYFWAINQGAAVGRFESPPTYQPAPAPAPVPVGGGGAGQLPQPVELFPQPTYSSKIVAAVQDFFSGGVEVAQTTGVAPTPSTGSIWPIVLIVGGVVLVLFMARRR